MRKTLSLIAIGVAAVLAVTMLPGSAAAKETKLKCEGAGACTFTATGGETNISIVGGDTVKCTGVTGNGEVSGLNAERESTTDIIIFLYTGCKEQNTAFHFTCSNTGTAGNITSNLLVTHFIEVPLVFFTLVAVLETNVNLTFTCAGGFASTQVTGSLIGEWENKCNTNTGTVQKQIFSTTGDGAQSVTTYTGSTFKLEGKTSHSSGGTYANAAISGTTTLTYNQNVILTCA
jgi:hypothetical protein